MKKEIKNRRIENKKIKNNIFLRVFEKVFNPLNY